MTSVYVLSGRHGLRSPILRSTNRYRLLDRLRTNGGELAIVRAKKRRSKNGLEVRDIEFSGSWRGVENEAERWDG